MISRDFFDDSVVSTESANVAVANVNGRRHLRRTLNADSLESFCGNLALRVRA